MQLQRRLTKPVMVGVRLDLKTRNILAKKAIKQSKSLAEYIREILRREASKKGSR